MPRHRLPSLTDGEARLMHVLWDKGSATVSGVVEALSGRPKATYSTVQTMLRILERKGYATHEKVGRAFVYRALLDRHQARRRALGHLVARLFDNSPSLLVLNVLEDEALDRHEVERLKRLISKA